MAAIEKLIGKSIPLTEGDAAPAQADGGKPEKSLGKSAKPAKSVKPANGETKKAEGGRGRGKSRKSSEAHPGELPAPPDCKGNTLHDTGHVPAFLLR